LLPTFASVINGVLLPFVFILNLLTLGAFLQVGGAAPTSRFKLPMETTTNAERGWSYIVGGVTLLLLFIIIYLAITSGYPSTA
jgi:hypothetical protein